MHDIRLILLTHIHLDHAGATGSLLARVPHIQVGVHERGAPHMIDPAKLLASATRLYGDRMDTLWGAFEPVPAAQVQVFEGGERLDVGGRPIRVAYTPGHAVHHVSYLDETDGTAYVGDTCGIRVVGDYTIAATPPPDIDLEIWDRSLTTIDDWQPTSLLVTHFGTVTGARAHLARYPHRAVENGRPRASVARPGGVGRGEGRGLRRSHARRGQGVALGARSRDARTGGAVRADMGRARALLAQAGPVIVGYEARRAAVSHATLGAVMKRSE